MADVEQMKKMVPLITHEITFGQHVRKLVLGVHIFDLDLGVSAQRYTEISGSDVVIAALPTLPCRSDPQVLVRTDSSNRKTA